MVEPKEMVKVVDNTKKHPEDRQYLICIRARATNRTIYDDDGYYETYDEWTIVTGRTACYEYIKENIEIIDFDESFVLVETLPLNKRKSIYAFMKYAGEYYNDGFDIEDYIKGDWDEDDYDINNGIDIMVNSEDRVDMKMFLDGNVDTKDLN